jgi:aminoglycoside phosphotransferase family enzyme
MQLDAVMAAFREGRVTGPRGVVAATGFTLTWKALLVFGDAFVLKLRRPLDVDGENQAGLGARKVIALRERHVGRRIAPGVYWPDAELALGDEGALELRSGDADGEPVVAMKRLDAAARLDAVLQRPGVEARHLFALMAHLLRFHVDAPVMRVPVEGAAAEPVAARWEMACAALRAEGVAVAFEEAGRARLDGLAQTFATRRAEGRVRSVHGALGLDAIFLGPDGDVAGVIDPADGPDAERFIDTGEELAGLALELRLLRSAHFVGAVMGHYAGLAADRTLPRVVGPLMALVALKRAGRALREAAFEGRSARERAETLLGLAEELVGGAVPYEGAVG